MTHLCSLCKGACCEVLRVATPTPDHTQWIDGRAIDAGVDAAGAFALVPCRCTYLTEAGQCMVYEQRPLFCKLFKPGGEECRMLIRKLRPQLSARRNIA